MSLKKEKIKSPRVTPANKINVTHDEFSVHVGQKVKELMRVRGYSYQEFADKLRITKNGLANRLLKPHYGTYYDVIKTSIALEYDFLSEGIVAIKKAGVSVDTLPAQAELALLKAENEQLKEELERFRKVIDKLTNN